MRFLLSVPLATFVVLGLGSAAAAQFHDDFTKPSLDKSWTWSDPGKDASFKLRSGSLQMIVPPGNDHTTGHGAPLYSGPMLTVPVTGDFVITTHVTVAYGQVPAAKESGLMIWKDKSNNFQFKRTNAFNSQNVLTYGNIGNARTTFHGNVRVSAKAVYLQVRRIGSSFTSYFSTNGQTWTKAGGATWKVTGSLRVGIATSYWLWFGSSKTPALGDYAFFDLQLARPSLRVDRAGLAAATGGTITLTIDRGTGAAGHQYILVGSIHGNTPGTLLPGGARLPLNWDPLTDLMLSLRNSPSVFPGTAGKLDASGRGVGRVLVPANALSGVIGLSLRFAGVTIKNPAAAFVPTNPVAVAVLK